MRTLALGGVPRAFDIVFMDCDGVIFDVNAHKARGFGQALEGYPADAREALMAFHREHGGMSRYDKFRHFFRNIHPVDDEERAMEEALARFAAISERGYQDLEPVAEALAFSNKMGCVYVVSGADEAELRRIFDAKGISDRFVSVLGSPVSKREHMTTVLYERFCPANHSVMVGDGRSDFESAHALGMPFVFLREMSLWATADETLRNAPDVFIAESWPDLLSWTLEP